MSNFADLGVSSVFSGKLAEKSITVPTKIQRLVIPPFLEGKNIIFRSATGTGKTFAYLIPALQQILSGSQDYKSGPQLLVCAPTLELCSQIKNDIDFLLGGNLKAVLLSGSVNLNRQIDLLKAKPPAVVGNSGRLLMLADMGKLKLGSLNYLVLDEADRLINADSRDDTAALLQIITRQTGKMKAIAPVTAACSATVSAQTGKILGDLFSDAVYLETNEQEILREHIEHWAIFSESRKKTSTLISFLAAVKPKKVLVFCGRSFDAGKMVSVLQRHGTAAAGLYSGMDKKDRKAALDKFRSGRLKVLVSTDLAARGLDIEGISHIAALDVSDNNEVYIHRAGRTGRAGKRGIMVSIGDETDMRRLSLLEKKLGIKIYPKELYGGRLEQPILPS